MNGRMFVLRNSVVEPSTQQTIGRAHGKIIKLFLFSTETFLYIEQLALARNDYRGYNSIGCICPTYNLTESHDILRKTTYFKHKPNLEIFIWEYPRLCKVVLSCSHNQKRVTRETRTPTYHTLIYYCLLTLLCNIPVRDEPQRLIL